MKKFALCLLALTGFISAPLTFASDSVASGYYTTVRPNAAANTKAAKTLFPPTDITIINASNTLIWATILADNSSDLINPGMNYHIRHGTYAGDTYVDLKDPNGTPFYYAYASGPFCRLAVVTVYGTLGAYRVNVDKELCY